MVCLRRGGEADEIGVEAFEYLAPAIVNRAVAFISDDKVEGLDRDVRVVNDRRRLREETRRSNGRDAALAAQAGSPCSEVVARAFVDLLAREFFQGGHCGRK